MNTMLRNTLICSLFVAMSSNAVFAADATTTSTVKKPSIYKQADSNHDGKLDQNEYNAWLQLRKERLAKIAAELPDFAAMDTNKDGVVDKNEMKAGLQAFKAKLSAE